MKPGVFFIDVDGTLVGPDGVHPDVWPALAALRAGGWRLAICTGRPGRGDALAYAARVDPDGLHVFESGAAIVRGDGVVHVAHLLDDDTVAAAVDLAAAASVTLEGYTATGHYVAPHRNDHIARHEALLGVPVELRPIGPGAGWVRLQLVVDKARWPALEPRVRALPRASVHLGESPKMPDVFFIAVIAPGVSKGSAVQAVCDAYRVPAEEAAMAGDNLNDLEALRLVGARFVVEDGDPAALAIATEVIPSASAGGVADAARRLLER